MDAVKTTTPLVALFYNEQVTMVDCVAKLMDQSLSPRIVRTQASVHNYYLHPEPTLFGEFMSRYCVDTSTLPHTIRDCDSGEVVEGFIFSSHYPSDEAPGARDASKDDAPLFGIYVDDVEYLDVPHC